MGALVEFRGGIITAGPSVGSLRAKRAVIPHVRVRISQGLSRACVRLCACAVCEPEDAATDAARHQCARVVELCAVDACAGRSSGRSESGELGIKRSWLSGLRTPGFACVRSCDAGFGEAAVCGLVHQEFELFAGGYEILMAWMTRLNRKERDGTGSY